MRALIKRSIAMIIALSVVLGAGVATVAAQQTKSGPASGNGFRVSPVRSELTIDKGKSQQLTITVENPSDIPTTAKAVVNDFVSSDQENGEPRLILDNSVPLPKNDFTKLVRGLHDIDLGPREKKDITISIAVPADANAGGYYGAIRFLPSVINNSGNVGLTASVGTIVLVRVPGNLTERLELVQMGASQKDHIKSFFNHGDIDVVVRLKNTGDIHVKPFGKVQIKDMFGKVVKEYELNNVEPRANILPDSIRKFTNPVSKPSHGWIGRYTITTSIGYSQGSGDLINAKTSFWYIPNWVFIALLVLVLVVAGVVFFLLKRRDHKLNRARH